MLHRCYAPLLLLLCIALADVHGAEVDVPGTPGAPDTSGAGTDGRFVAEDNDRSSCANLSYLPRTIIVPGGGGGGDSYEYEGKGGTGISGSADTQCALTRQGTVSPSTTSDSTNDDPADEQAKGTYGVSGNCWPVVYLWHQEIFGGNAPGAAGDGGESGCGTCAAGTLLPGGDTAPAMGLPAFSRIIYTKDNQGLQPFGDQHHSWHLPLRLAYSSSNGLQTLSFLPPNGSVTLQFRTDDHLTFTRIMDKGRSVGGTCVRDGDDLVLTTEYGASYVFALPVDVTPTSNRVLYARRVVARTGAAFDLVYGEGTPTSPRLTAVHGPLGSLTLTWRQVAGAWVIDQLTGFDGRVTVYDYAVVSGKPTLASALHADGSQSTFTYDLSPVLLPHYDNAGFSYRVTRPREAGRLRDLTYVLETRLGRARLVEDALGRDVYRRVANGWDGSLLWRQLRDAQGREVRRWFDSQARLVRTLDLTTGAEWTFGWNGAKQVTAMRNELNQRTTFERLVNTFRIAATLHPDGSTASMTWGAGNQYSSRTDRLGRTTLYTRDARGLVTAIQHPDGSTRQRAYNGLGQLTREVDELGRERIILYSLDGDPAHAAAAWDDSLNQGYPVRAILPADPGNPAPVWTWHWNPVTQDLLSVTDPQGRSVSYTYDLQHRVTRIAYADGSDEQIVFGDPASADAGLVVARKDRNDQWTTITWNAAGQEVLRTRPDGTTIATGHDGFGRVAARTVAGARTTFTYDAAGRQTARTQLRADGSALTTTWQYDTQDRVVAQTDPYGRTVGFVYDVNGRRIRTVQGLTPSALALDPVVAAALAERDGSGPWLSASIGTPSLVGSASSSSSGSTWTVQGAGTDFWGTADQGHWVAQPLGSDAVLTARFLSHDASDAAAKAGLMLRRDLTPGSPRVLLAVTPGSGVVLQRRTVPDGSVTSQVVIPAASVTGPIWLRLARVGTDVVASTSEDGVAWTEAARIPVAWSLDTHAGLAVTARKASELSTAVFTDVAFTLPVSPVLAPVVATLAWEAHLLGRSRADADLIITEQSLLANGLPVAHIDGRGIRHTSAYDVRDRLVEQITADAAIALDGSATLLASPEAARTTIAYDLVGNRLSQQLPRSFERLIDGAWLAGADGAFVTAWTYTARDQRATETVAAGLDALAQPRAEQATTTWTYTLTDQVATQTDARGGVTQYGYSPCCDRLISVTDAGGGVSTMTYDSVGNRLTQTDANGLTTTWAYDVRHRPIATTNAAGETTTISYDDDLTDGVGVDTTVPAAVAGLGFGPGHAGSAVTQTNPAGETTLSIQDGLGRTVRTLDGNGNAVSMQYDTVVAGLVETAQSDALGHTTRERTDGAGRPLQIIDAIGAVTTQVFDGNGNRTSLRDPQGVGMDCTYDAQNREILCTDTRSDVATVRATVFDAHGNVVSQTDALSAVEISVYDARDRRISHTDRIGATTSFAYDLTSNLVQITDAEGGITAYDYDSRHLLTAETFPTGQQGKTVRTYTYDAGRRLTSRMVTTDPSSGFSETTQYAYDGANRLLVRGYPADGLNDTFQYDVASRLIAAQSERYRVDVVRSYDAAGRLTSESQTFREGSISGTTVSSATYTVGYGYDAANRTTSITYPDGAVVTRGYTDRHQLATVAHTPLGGSAAAIIDRVYDSAGRLTETAYGNGLTETRTYTPSSHLVASIAIPGVTDFGYVYDANRRKTQEANGVLPAQTQDFSYDAADRLTNWQRPVVADVQAWTLSLVGDWNSTTRNGMVESRTHTDVHELTGRTIGANPTIPLGYDAKGNLSNDGEGRIYTWDPENRLQRAVVSGSASPTGLGAVATYQYDALGRRVAKTVGGKTTRFLSAGAQVVEERDGAPVPTQASITGGSADGDLANLGLTPPSGGILSGSGVLRVNFQPNDEQVPAGYLKDSGKLYAMRTNGHSYGWDAAVTGDSRVRRGAVPVPELDTLIHLQKTATPRTWEIALPNGTYPVIVVAGDAVFRNQTNHLSIAGIQVTDPDPSQAQGYEQGDFDGFAVLATVTDGRLTIATGPGAVNAKICFVEIGPEGTALDQAALDRLATLVETATTQTANAPGVVTAKRQYVYGNYVDELLSYTVGAGASPTRYFTHANHLYSIAATTNAAGAVVERYAYDAYGTQTVTNAAGTVTLGQTAVSQSRGFTGYILDQETGLYHARARQYDSKLGRFIGRDPLGYVDGLSLYASYFIPLFTDPSGESLADCDCDCDPDYMVPRELFARKISDYKVKSARNTTSLTKLDNTTECPCPLTLTEETGTITIKLWWNINSNRLGGLANDLAASGAGMEDPNTPRGPGQRAGPGNPAYLLRTFWNITQIEVGQCTCAYSCTYCGSGLSMDP